MNTFASKICDRKSKKTIVQRARLNLLFRKK